MGAARECPMYEGGVVGDKTPLPSSLQIHCDLNTIDQCSSVGRAPFCRFGGPGFESRHRPNIFSSSSYDPGRAIKTSPTAIIIRITIMIIIIMIIISIAAVKIITMHFFNRTRYFGEPPVPTIILSIFRSYNTAMN